MHIRFRSFLFCSALGDHAQKSICHRANTNCAVRQNDLSFGSKQVSIYLQLAGYSIPLQSHLLLLCTELLTLKSVTFNPINVCSHRLSALKRGLKRLQTDVISSEVIDCV